MITAFQIEPTKFVVTMWKARTQYAEEEVSKEKFFKLLDQYETEGLPVEQFQAGDTYHLFVHKE